ncbi:hypothetical protein [Streptomyces hundungensis]|uniref:hypothetical protein n=1 Tax=Streptomyces hundungensis TaxID=1077946 RepID=UPI003F53F750
MRGPCRSGGVPFAETEGPDRALALVDALDLDAYHLFHATRADLLRRLGRSQEAVLAYAQALDRTTNVAERAFLERRLAEVGGRPEV